MFADDVQLERIELEYKTLRGTQDKLMDGMNGLDAAFQRLSEAVLTNREAIEANRQAIEANRAAIEANREEILANRRAIAENSQMLADIMDHLQVPKKRTGFVGTD